MVPNFFEAVLRFLPRNRSGMSNARPALKDTWGILMFIGTCSVTTEYGLSTGSHGLFAGLLRTPRCDVLADSAKTCAKNCPTGTYCTCSMT